MLVGSEEMDGTGQQTHILARRTLGARIYLAALVGEEVPHTIVPLHALERLLHRHRVARHHHQVLQPRHLIKGGVWGGEKRKGIIAIVWVMHTLQFHIHICTHVGEGRHVAAVHPAVAGPTQAALAQGGGVDERGGGRGGPAPQHGRHHVQVHQLSDVVGWVE